MAARPLVTVITPTYNRVGHLEETVRSVLDQDYPNIEYLVIDDGSKDATLEVLRKFEGRVQVYSHPNMGQAKTLNRGFSLAKGEFIGLVSDDDPVLPGLVRRVVETFDSHPEGLVVYPDWVRIDADGRVETHIRTEEYGSVEMIRRHHCVPGPGTFFRRGLLDAVGGWDPQFRYVADLDFWFRAGLHGSFVRIPETLATFRMHSSGLSTAGQGSAMAEEHLRLVRKFFALPGLPPEVRVARREATSSARFIAGFVCGPPSLRKMGHLLAAVAYAPLLHLGKYRDRSRFIARQVRDFLSISLHRAGGSLLRAVGLRTRREAS